MSSSQTHDVNMNKTYASHKSSSASAEATSTSSVPASNEVNRRRLTGKELGAAVLEHAIFDADDSGMKHDIIQTVIQYLQDEGYHGSAMVVQDEANVKAKHIQSKRSQLRRMKRAILDGDWNNVEHLLTRTTFRNMMPFKYAVYRQQYLELIEAQQIHDALSLLQLRLKPLESYAYTPDEFRDLCYLLTCKSVADAVSFRDWDGIISTRSTLVDQYSRLLDFDSTSSLDTVNHERRKNERDVPPGRLIHLLQQALAFQILSSKHHPSIHVPSRIATLLEDYEPPIIPNAKATQFVGHSAPVKAVTFLGHEGHALVSASSDQTLRIWNSTNGSCMATLSGHSARVWDCCAIPNGTLLASSSGDGIVKLWDTSNVVEHLNNDSTSIISQVTCVTTLTDHEKDCYALRFHAHANALVSGGYDRIIRLHDIEYSSSSSPKQLRAFHGHHGSITAVTFNARGNLIISASKDCSVKFWDALSGVCVRTMSAHLGEVTSVEASICGTFLLTGAKDNSVRMWDVRMTNRTLARFKGYQNTAKNFIRADFGPREAVIVAGSEDGFIYLWDRASAKVISTLGLHSPVAPSSPRLLQSTTQDQPTFPNQNHTGALQQHTVYRATWNSRQSLLASCGDDGMVTTWTYSENDVNAKNS